MACARGRVCSVVFLAFCGFLGVPVSLAAFLGFGSLGRRRGGVCRVCLGAFGRCLLALLCGRGGAVPLLGRPSLVLAVQAGVDIITTPFVDALTAAGGAMVFSWGGADEPAG